MTHETQRCLVCGREGGYYTTRLVQDHCHLHGHTRGPLCDKCNHHMGDIDRGKLPGPHLVSLAGVLRLQEHYKRCPDCPPWLEK